MGTLVLKGKVPAGIRAGYPVAVLNAARKLKFGFPYTVWDRNPLLPQDVTPRKLQSIQYPPGMEPKGETISVRRWKEWMVTPPPSTWSYNRNL